MTESSFSPERSALRGIGSSLVVICHALIWAEIGLPISAAGVVILGGLSNVGWVGVALFLSLSIYLLMGSLDTNRDLSRYFLRRIKRIWPMYFGMCVVVFIFLDPNWQTLILNLTFVAVFNPAWAFHIQGFWASGYVIWTLQIEEFAYLFFPLIAWLGHQRRLWVGWGLIVCTMGAFVVGEFGHPASYFTPWPWLGCYGFGLLIYEKALPIREGLPLWVLLAAMPFIFPTLGWPVGIILIGPLMVWLIAYPPKMLKRASLVIVGECSYALYLTHLFWMEFFGLWGIVIAYPSSWLIEGLQRHKQMIARVRSL